MDSFEINKLIGALLVIVFVVFSVALISDGLFSSPAPENSTPALPTLPRLPDLVFNTRNAKRAVSLLETALFVL